MNKYGEIQRVFILGMDGAGNFIKDADAPYFYEFVKKGAVTYDAQAVFPTISAECWGSMLHGVMPEKHGLNNELAASREYPDDSPYPSVFKLAREKWPDAKLASFVSWGPINKGIVEDGINVHKESMPDEALVEAIETYLDNNPDVKLLYLQLDEPDGAGHRYGYGKDSSEYLQAITNSDRLIGRVLSKIEQLGLHEDSLIMIVTDHGGGGADRHGHGSDHPSDKNVFWACAGPGIKPGTMPESFTIVDVAAIVAHALGLQIPATHDAVLPAGLFE